MAPLLAFTVEHAARVTHVSERRIRYWDSTGVLRPSFSQGEPRRTPFGRIYSFRDLVGLRTLGELRDKYALPLQQLRTIGAWLSARYDAPWSTLRFHVIGRGRTAHVVFRDPDADVLLSASRKGQAVIPVDLAPIAEAVERGAQQLSQRAPADIGKIVQHRNVLGNSPVLAGTRVPTAAVWDFHQAGYSTDAILLEYPRLKAVDIDSAIAFEGERRTASAR